MRVLFPLSFIEVPLLLLSYYFAMFSFQLGRFLSRCLGFGVMLLTNVLRLLCLEASNFPRDH